MALTLGGHLGGPLGASWGLLGPFRGRLGALLGGLGSLLGHLETMCGGISARPGGISGRTSPPAENQGKAVLKVLRTHFLKFFVAIPFGIPVVPEV